jgi:pseudouridine synthase
VARLESRTLERLLSRAGLCSRSEARAWIEHGRVRVRGRVVRNPEHWVDLHRDPVLVDGRPLARAERVYLALHKPRGVVTTAHDPEGRRTVYDLLSAVPVWVAPVGRLDRDTSGLILLSNDSDFGDRITDPASHVPKTYAVRTARPIDDEALERLRAGVRLDDGPTRPAEVELRRSYKGYAVLELTITEGRNRQVRRMLAAVGNKVALLKRVRIGPVDLGALPSGGIRALTRAELRALGVHAP